MGLLVQILQVYSTIYTWGTILTDPALVIAEDTNGVKA